MILSDEVTILKMPAKKGSVLTDMSRNKATPKNNELISSQKLGGFTFLRKVPKSEN